MGQPFVICVNLDSNSPSPWRYRERTGISLSLILNLSLLYEGMYLMPGFCKQFDLMYSNQTMKMIGKHGYNHLWNRLCTLRKEREVKSKRMEEENEQRKEKGRRGKITHIHKELIRKRTRILQIHKLSCQKNKNISAFILVTHLECWEHWGTD